MALTFDAAYGCASPGAPWSTWTHTCGTLNSGIVIIGAICNSSFSQATWDGSSMTSLTSMYLTDASYLMGIWYVLNPTSGDHTIAIQKSGLSGVQTPGASISYDGINQSVPYGEVVTDKPSGGTSSFSTTITPDYINSVAIEFETDVNNPPVDIIQDNSQTFRAASSGGFCGLELVTKSFSDTDTLTLGFHVAAGNVSGSIIVELPDGDAVGGGSFIPFL